MHAKIQVLRDSVTRMLDTFDRFGDAAEEGRGYFSTRAIRLAIAEADAEDAYRELRTIFCAEMEDLLEISAHLPADTQHKVQGEYNRFSTHPTLEKLLV